MIKVAKIRDGHLFLALGLSQGNLERLIQGQGILIDLEEMNLKPKNDLLQGRILILYDQTEAQIAKIFEPYIGPNTIIHGEWPLSPPPSGGLGGTGPGQETTET